MKGVTLSVGRRYTVGLLLAAMLSLVVLPTWADPIKPSATDRHITLAVVSMLRRQHLSRHPLDDEISQRSLKSLLKDLDPWKVYFYQSDVDAFLQHQDDLDDMVQKGEVGFAYDVFKVFLQRVDERVALVDQLLATPPDFTADEQIVTDRDLARYPRSVAEARDKWRKRIKYDLLVLKADKIEGQEAYDKLHRRYNSFAKQIHQTDGQELLERFLGALTGSFDPHTDYMSPATLENFEIAMRLQLDGIGASLQSLDGYTIVKRIIPGGAAHKDGRLKLEDKIVGVGQGTEGEIVDTIDMKLTDVVKMIRGKRGTVVRLEVTSVDNPERKLIDITRAKIELKDAEAQAEIFPVGSKADGQPYNIGVIRLDSFYMDMEGAARGLPNFRSTTRDVRKILEDFKQQDVDAVLLDLSRNGGGSLTEAINLTGLFIDEGPVVQVKDANDRVQPFRDLEPGMVWSGPLVVLISKFSASASEILAGAVQDYRRGLVIGDRTSHGKGTVQSLTDISERVFPVPNAPRMGAIKITTQQFYRPSGDSTQKRGVLSDIELPSLTTYLDVGEADLDYPVNFDKVEPLNYRRLDYVNPTILDRLTALSEQRCRDSEDFQKVRRNIERYETRKAQKAQTLNAEKFLAERAELNADKEVEKTINKVNGQDETGIVRDFYLDEAMAIAVDYLKLKQLASVN